jgi:hypothetical protein
MRREIGIAAVVAWMVGVAACGAQTKTVIERAPATTATGTATVAKTSTVTSTRASGMTKAQAAKTYLADVGPSNAVLLTFKSSTDSNESQSQLATQVKPVVVAYEKVNSQLLSLAHDYPPAASDLKAEASNDAQLIGDMEAVGTSDDLTQWFQTTAKDAAASDVTVNTVRLDLGLPEVKK